MFNDKIKVKNLVHNSGAIGKHGGSFQLFEGLKRRRKGKGRKKKKEKLNQISRRAELKSDNRSYSLTNQLNTSQCPFHRQSCPAVTWPSMEAFK